VCFSDRDIKPSSAQSWVIKVGRTEGLNFPTDCSKSSKLTTEEITNFYFTLIQLVFVEKKLPIG